MAQSTSTRIIHSVILKLKQGSNENAFFEAAKKLSSIPGVEKFECLKQTSKKNKFELGLSMEFENQKVYDLYNSHPDHVAFIQHVWLKEVEDFMEIDYNVIK